jgi:hypothetical protein
MLKLVVEADVVHLLEDLVAVRLHSDRPVATSTESSLLRHTTDGTEHAG